MHADISPRARLHVWSRLNHLKYLLKLAVKVLKIKEVTLKYYSVKINHEVCEAWLWMACSGFGTLHMKARDQICAKETTVRLFPTLPRR